MTIDLSDVSKQVRGFYNSGFTTGIACAQVAYKCLTTPTDYPGQRRQLPLAEGDHADGHGDQRRAAVPDAGVDDLPDDGDRHDLQGAGAGDSGPFDRRASCRSRVPQHPRHLAGGWPSLHRRHRPARRRLGREVVGGRRLGHGLHQRRRHAQQPDRAARGQVSRSGRALLDPPGQRRRGPYTRAASAPRWSCRRCRRSR